MNELNFMDSYEDNDEIGQTIREVFGDKISYYVEYHYYSDGKHLVNIEGKEIQVNAWTLKEDFKKELKEEFKELI